MDTNAIEARDLKKIYRSNTAEPVRALDGISLQVPQGCVFGLLGPNGAGKSTLVKILTTITSPTSGAATVLGRDVTRSPLEVRRQIAVVLQQTAVEKFVDRQRQFFDLRLSTRGRPPRSVETHAKLG